MASRKVWSTSRSRTAISSVTGARLRWARAAIQLGCNAPTTISSPRGFAAITRSTKSLNCADSADTTPGGQAATRSALSGAGRAAT